MQMSGKVADGQLLKFLRTVANVGSSGRLELKNEEAWARVIIRTGRVVAAITDQTPRLGELLVDADLISEQELMSVLAMQKRKRVRQPLGMILVQLGVLEGDCLQSHLQDLRARAFSEILEWTEGDYEFTAEEEMDVWGQEPGGLPLDLVLPQADPAP